MSERRQAASWIADEYGGSYLNNPEQQNRDLAAANDMAVLIQRMVRDRNGGEAGYRRAGELINETLDELRGRAPFGFVTPAFALGTTQVLLEKANTMDGPQFLQYLEGIRDRDNPLFFWQRTTLDPLFDEVKDRTRAHVEEIYGKSTFTVFDALKGQRGPVAFSAGAADAVLDEVGTGGRGLILGAANPVEAGRQAVDMLRNLDRVPQALQQQVREAQQLIQAAGLDDYHKGFLTVRVAFIALDAADVVEAGMSIGNLARRLRNGEVDNIGDAIRALDEGPQVMRQRGEAGDAAGLSAADAPTPARTPTASPSAQAATLTDQLVNGLPANYREPYREAFTQLLRGNNYDTPEEVAGFSRWLNDNPDHAVTRRYHEIAQETMQQRVVSAYPDRVEFAYQRALDDTFRDAGLTTPQQRMGYMEAFNGPNAAAFRTALDERALTHVVDNSLRQIPENVRDAYRGSLASILGEQGHLGQGRFDPDGAQQYINNLAGAPGGPSAMAVHNRAMTIVVNGAADRFPDGTEAYYARAYRQTFEAENIRDPSAAQRYIDNLDGAPNGQAMRAVHNRATAAIVGDVVDDLPRNVQPAYARALRLSLDAAGKDSPAEVLDYVRNLTDGRQVQSMAALHQRAFDSVVQSAVSSIDEPSRPAYTQALRESLDAGGRGPARTADGSPTWDYGSVERAQQYVIDLATSPQAMQRIHDRADELLGRSRTPDATPPAQTPPQDRVDPPNNPPPQNLPPTDRQTPDPDQRQLPPSSQPNDPLLPFHAVPRTERMQSPDPVVVNGRSYDVLGMTDNGELRLRPPTDNVRTVPDNAMFVQTPTTSADLRVGAEVVYSGRTWRVGEPVEAGQLPGVAERSHRLVDPHNDSATALVPESRTGEIFKRVGREVTYDDKQWEFGAATGRGYVLIDPANRDNTVTVPLNQADQIRMRFAGGTEYTLQGLYNGVLRVAPSETSGELSYRPTPGETFEARLKNREMEGVYSIHVGENGELTATGRVRNGTEVSERIQASDIASRYVDVDSPEFNQRFQVDAFLHREAETRGRAIATEPTGFPVRDPNLGAMPETVQPQVLLGVRGLDAQADFIRRHAAEVTPGTEPRLTVFNMGFSNQGEAQRVVDAVVDFRRQHPDARIEVVAERVRFESASRNEGYGEFLQTLRDNGVQLNFFENGDTSRQVIHAKGVIVNDHVLFTTGAVIDASKNKVDIATELPPDAARSFIRFFDQGINGNADPATRQQLLADMSRQGVLVDDPITRTPYISRTQDALINGAENRLFISLSDLTNPDTTRTIIDRVGNGVNVEIQYREMDPTSRQLLDRAMQQYPDRLRVENISNWDPRPHYNVIVADDKQAYVGTSYLWPNQQQQIHHTRSFENGVLLQGESVRQLQSQMEALRSLQPANPGQRLLNPAPDDAPDVGVRLRNETAGSIAVSAPAGSSIGVDVQNSTTGTIQTVSGSGNMQVSGNRETLGAAANAVPDANGNVQVADAPGLRIELQNPGTSGRTGTDVRIDNSTVNGGVQSIVGNDNAQIDINQARINGDRRQTVVDGDNNRQTQNLGANVTADSVTQTIDGRSDSRQQVGNDVSSSTVRDDATMRPRDDIAPARPQPLRSGDRSYDIVGVNDGERPSLEVVTHNAVPRYVPTDALVPRPLGEPHPDARARQVEVVTAGAQGEVREAYEIAGVRRDGLLLNRPGESGAEPRFVPYADPAARIEFAFPNGSTYVARQTVDGSVRFDPTESERTRIALEPGMQFEARLRGRETESPYRIEVAADFSFSARSTDPARGDDRAERISASDIAPTWQRVTSTTAPDTELFVDSAQYRRAAQRVGREGEPDYPIGTLGGESTVRHGFANQLYRPVLDALRDPATTGDVSIAMYGIGTSREGRQYTDALMDYARRNPDAQVTIHSGDAQIDGRRGEALRDWLSERHPNVRISEPLPPSNFNVPHEKIVAVGDRVFIGSEKIGTSMSRKVGFMAEMGAEESQLVHSYIQGLGDARTDSAQTRQTLTTLAERGILIDDPRAGFYPNTAAMNRVLDEAQGHLRIYQSDLIDTVATQRIIDRARDGVQIDLRYRDIDPQSQRMLEQAAGELPNLRFQRVPNDPLHPIYQHENYVISERGGVLSSSYMWEPKAGQVPRYTNGGEGGVLLDPQQAQQYERHLDNAPTRQIGPGAILDLGEEAWNKLSPRLLEQLDGLRPQTREIERTPQPRDQAPPANDGRQSSLPDTAAPVSGRGDPGLDDARHPNHTLFASALDRIQAYERGRGIESGDFARNLAGDLTVRSVETGLPRINHVVFNAEGTRAFAVDTPNLDAEWRRVAYTDVAAAGQQTLAASSERLRELQPLALSPTAVQQDMQQRPDEQARNAARMV